MRYSGMVLDNRAFENAPACVFNMLMHGITRLQWVALANCLKNLESVRLSYHRN